MQSEEKWSCEEKYRREEERKSLCWKAQKLQKNTESTTMHAEKKSEKKASHGSNGGSRSMQ